MVTWYLTPPQRLPPGIPIKIAIIEKKKTRKIPKISPGAYLGREICVSKSIGLAFWVEVNVPFLFCFALYLRAIFQVQARGGLIFGGTI